MFKYGVASSALFLYDADLPVSQALTPLTYRVNFSHGSYLSNNNIMTFLYTRAEL